MSTPIKRGRGRPRQGLVWDLKVNEDTFIPNKPGQQMRSAHRWVASHVNYVHKTTGAVFETQQIETPDVAGIMVRRVK